MTCGGGRCADGLEGGPGAPAGVVVVVSKSRGDDRRDGGGSEGAERRRRRGPPPRVALAELRGESGQVTRRREPGDLLGDPLVTPGEQTHSSLRGPV